MQLLTQQFPETSSISPMCQVPGAVTVAALNNSQRNLPAFSLLPAHNEAFGVQK